MSCTTTWSNDRIELLRRLWRDGQSASAIARALGGVTRNAVIGKVHRLDLSRRRQPAREGTPQPRAAPSAPRNPRAKRAVKAASAAPRRIAAEQIQVLGLTDVAGVGRHACRWPIGDPKDPGFTLCGRAAARGAYCAVHGALAYRPTAPDHLLKLAGLR